MKSQTVYIGIDVSKASLQIDPFDHKTLEVPNIKSSILRLIERLKAHGDCTVCCEASGGYEKTLVVELMAAQVPVCLLNPKRVRDFAKSKGILAKTDKIDAAVLTAFGNQNQPSPKQPNPEWIERLQSLLIRRGNLNEMIKAENSRLDPEPPRHICKQIRSHLRFLDKQKAAVEAELKDLVKDIDELRSLYARLSEVKALGPITVLHLIGFIPELGQITDKQAAAIVGLAPFNKDSGTMRGRRFIQGGRPRIRKPLYMAAIVAKKHNPILKTFYDRLINQGKPPKVALIAVMRKLVVLSNRIAANPDFILS